MIAVCGWKPNIGAGRENKEKEKKGKLRKLDKKKEKE